MKIFANFLLRRWVLSARLRIFLRSHGDEKEEKSIFNFPFYPWASLAQWRNHFFIITSSLSSSSRHRKVFFVSLHIDILFESSNSQFLLPHPFPSSLIMSMDGMECERPIVKSTVELPASASARLLRYFWSQPPPLHHRKEMKKKMGNLSQK